MGLADSTDSVFTRIQSSRVLVPAGTSKSTSRHPGSWRTLLIQWRRCDVVFNNAYWRLWTRTSYSVALKPHCWLYKVYSMQPFQGWMSWWRDVNLLVPVPTSTRLDWECSVAFRFKVSWIKTGRYVHDHENEGMSLPSETFWKVMAFFHYSLFKKSFININPPFWKTWQPMVMWPRLTLPVSSFTIARYHVKFMPSFDYYIYGIHQNNLQVFIWVFTSK
jgi:hypothetical protein